MKWTNNEIAKLERLFVSGATYEEIGRKMGCTKNAVKSVIYKSEFFEKHGRRKTRVKKATPAVRRVKKAYNPNPVTDSTQLLVCTSHYEGDDMRMIADLIGRPMEQIEQILADCRENGYYDLINAKEG